MILSNFDYSTPTSLVEALTLLEQNPQAKLLAGGHMLLPQMKAQMVKPALLIDLCKVPELRTIRLAVDGSLEIGAFTTYRQLQESELLVTHAPLLRQCVAALSDPQVRNRGTVGGVLAGAHPGTDIPAGLLALGAELECVSSSGTRRISLDTFFVDAFQTVLHPTEILTTIIIPARPALSLHKTVYHKYKNPASGYALVGVALAVWRELESARLDYRIAVTGAGPYVQRAYAAETALRAGADLATAAQQATDGLSIVGDRWASTRYRSQIVQVLTRRALSAALADQ